MKQGLMNSRSLKQLNVSGNSIGDKGLKVLLRGVERHPSLVELRTSFNEITPIGGSCRLTTLPTVVMDVLPNSKLKVLDLSRNVIEDETVIMLGDMYRRGDKVKLCQLNISSCHITDVGLLYFMESLEAIESLKSLTMKDNFISEGCEKLLLDLVDKNDFLTEFELKGRLLNLTERKQNLHELLISHRREA